MNTTTELKLHKGQITKIKECAKDTFLLEFNTSEHIHAKAGQFISISCNKTLRRPFSIFKSENNTMSIIFRLKGDGTQFLANLKPGDETDFSGPFGNGFEIFNKKSVLVGAGLGLAPVSYLKRELDKKNIQNILLAGFPSKIYIPETIDNMDRIVTDDGTKGQQGNVIDALMNIYQTFKPQVIYACGPLVVLKKISKFALAHGIESYLSMENMMACSIGVCRGCVIDVKNGTETIKKSVCKDGPVFEGSEIVWKQ